MSGKRAIVTGGGRGIGKAVGMRLAMLGAETWLVGTKPDRLAEAAAGIEAAGGRARTAVADVSREEDVLRVFERAGDVDVLVNNAGIGRFAPIVSTTVEEWDLIMGVNLRGVFLCSREAMKSMAGRGGRIINIGSVVSIKGYADQGAYTASKHGLLGLSKVMAVEGRKDGIVTQVISPGGVDTDLIGDARPDLDRSGMMRPGDIADAVEYLLGQTGNAITDMVRLRRKSSAPW
ncbi:MAG: SDR family oxidoreductase [Planctomycetota bacterium]|nr:SDR family oxidoreductase [Planctomycetota bacterium]